MKREVYYWMALFALVIAAALFYRFYYSAGISLSARFVQNSSGFGQVYPYQKLYFDVILNNTGSTPVSDMGVAVKINGNTTYAPGVTIPAGKSVRIAFNYTPTGSGVYNFSVVADPGRLYNIVDRAGSAAGLEVTVDQPGSGEAYTLLPSNGIVSRSEVNSNLLGFLYYSDIGMNYNIPAFGSGSLPGSSSFFGIFFRVVGSELENVSSASAVYADGNSVSSMWIRGYVNPEIISIAAKGQNLTSHSYIENGNNVTVVDLTGNESLCSWYSDGWIKTVTSEGGGSCTKIADGNVSLLASPPVLPRVQVPFVSPVIIANYSSVSGNTATLGYTAFVENQSLISAGITTNNIPESVCGGLVSSVNNVSYCSAYVFGSNSMIGPVSLIRTTAIVSGYNLSAFSLVNTTSISRQIPFAIAAIRSLNVSGVSTAFASAVRSSCAFDYGFACWNDTYNGSTISFRLRNTIGKSARLNNIGCVLLGVPKYKTLNITLANDTAANITTTCYNNGSPAVALPYGLAFTLRMNYTVGNTTETVNGTAYVLG